MIPGPLRADCPPRMHPLAAAVWSPYWTVNAVEMQILNGVRRYWLELDSRRHGIRIEDMLDNAEAMHDARMIASRLLRDPHIAHMGTGPEITGLGAHIIFEGSGRTGLERRRQG